MRQNAMAHSRKARYRAFFPASGQPSASANPRAASRAWSFVAAEFPARQSAPAACHVCHAERGLQLNPGLLVISILPFVWRWNATDETAGAERKSTRLN